MKKKILSLCLFMACLLSYSTLSEAAENNVFIPDPDIRRNILSALKPTTIKNELPTVGDMLLLNDELGLFSTYGSLEGLQYAKNTEKLSVESSNVIDYRPISSLTNLKTYYSYSSMDQNTEKIIDLRVFSPLNKLESLNLGYANVTDLTPIENLKDLKYYYSFGDELKLPTVYVSQETRKFIVKNPVKYSSQFTKRNIEASSDKSDELFVEEKNNALVIDNLDINTKEVRLILEGSSETFTWQEGFLTTQNFIIPVSWY
ncbi:hypothetical protein ACYSNW_09920 [Enterococcus sp. LJL99]